MADDRNANAYGLLSGGVRRWVSKKEWASFRDVQVESIEALLGQPTYDDGSRDNVVISCPTAGGKTEAAFLPSLSIVENYANDHRDDDFVYMLYVAPLKALINDQYRRMCEMAAYSSIPVYIWHGDAPQAQKKQLMKSHYGILMTTPESLEAFLMRRGQWCNQYLTPIVTVIDEFHAFLGEGRGKQLMSLIDRIDAICAVNNRPHTTRIALSATLSKLDRVGKMLSPRSPFVIIDGNGGSTADETDIAIQTYDPPLSIASEKTKYDYDKLAMTIIDESKGHKTLTFAKSRYDVETMTATINDLCKQKGIDSQAFPHHGSLSKETRESLEKRLVNTDKPTMAIATVTLELGIDIGDIYKVFQIGAPNSVASLRQRVGRSGRRDGQRRVKCMATLATTESDMETELTTLVAEIELMNAGWFEAANARRKDVSVLVSEMLSVVEQYGSAYPDELRGLLCDTGAFTNISPELFTMVLEDMVAARYLAYTEDGTLVIDVNGERETNDWHFYATFQTEESYTVRSGKKTIGEITPPSTSMDSLARGGTFMLAGKYWEVLPPIDMKGKVINVKQMSQRASFLVPVTRGGGDVSGHVKQKRISLLNGKDAELVPDYLDDNGKEALADARAYAKMHRLNQLGLLIYDAGTEGSETDSEVADRCRLGYTDNAIVTCMPPLDNAACDALTKMFNAFGLIGEMRNLPLYRIAELAMSCVDNRQVILDNRVNYIDDAMLNDIRMREKYNHILSDDTLRQAYVDEALDFKGAFKWSDAFLRFWESLHDGTIENESVNASIAERSEARRQRNERGRIGRVQAKRDEEERAERAERAERSKRSTKKRTECEERINKRDKCW